MKGYLDLNYICYLLAKSSRTLSYRTRTEVFPEPDLTIGKKYLWKVQTIINYLDTGLYRYESLIFKIKNDVK